MMKTTLATLTILSFFITACSKNEPPQNTEPANYVETREKLIQNPEKDSLQKDSTTVPTAMPAQPPTSENK